MKFPLSYTRDPTNSKRLTFTSTTHCSMAFVITNLLPNTSLHFLYVSVFFNSFSHLFLASFSVCPVRVGKSGGLGLKSSGFSGNPRSGSSSLSGRTSTLRSTFSSLALLHFSCPGKRKIQIDKDKDYYVLTRIPGPCYAL